MADDASLIFFRENHFDLAAAQLALADRGASIRREGNTLFVRWGNGPELRVVFVREDYVRQEAAEISAGTPHAEAMSQCDVRFEIIIDDLDAVLDEINTLIEVQATLQNATRGFLFKTWNGAMSAPGE
jgi:hypothetical protein